jgi:cytochrome c biogenesis protein CcmG, thiol:disulfide interchange protein DsbE
VFAPLLALAIAATPAVTKPLIGDPAPALDLPDLQGKRAGAWKFKHRVTVVEFFTTWCVPCGRSLDDLRAIRRELGEDVQVVIVSQDARLAVVRDHFRDRPAPEGAVILHDPSGEAGRRWGRDRIPTTFFVNRDGRVRHIHRGHGPGFRDRATRWLRGMLGSPS